MIEKDAGASNLHVMTQFLTQMEVVNQKIGVSIGQENKYIINYCSSNIHNVAGICSLAEWPQCT